MTKASKKRMMKAVSIGLLLNIILAAIKLTFGYLGESQALVSDGFNSLSDIFMSVMIFFVIKIAMKKPDKNHPYGHQKFEGVLYFSLGIVFLLTAFGLAYQAIDTLIHYEQITAAPKPITIYISAVSLMIKLFMAYFYFKLYKANQHPTLKAEAQNHFMDSWSTTITLVGIVLTQFGLYIFDAVAALVVALFILRLAVQIIIEAISYLVDEAPMTEFVEEIKQTILEYKGVLNIDDFKARRHMMAYYVDVEIAVEATLSLIEAHQIAERVHTGVEKEFPDVIHCMVHVNPYINKK